ncbi:hypothetical protein GCM10010309_02340 [Streptomyces violaceochromogenes]|nr:hypothetical protein GCM10010309_02340 [Streptomyces violaceochromogenes]
MPQQAHTTAAPDAPPSRKPPEPMTHARAGAPHDGGGPARKVLVDRPAAADLVIVGAWRRQDHFGLQLGRVAHTLLHHAQCLVAVVPQHA